MLVLHPRHKLDYFKQAGWQVEWVSTAHDLVYDTFNSSYATQYHPGDISEDNSSDEEKVSHLLLSLSTRFSS